MQASASSSAALASNYSHRFLLARSIARELEGTLFSITHEGSDRIIAEHERRIAEIEALRARDGSNAQQADQLIAQSAAVRDAQLSQLRA